MSEFSISITLGVIAAISSLAGSLIVLKRKKITEKFLFYWISLGAGFILAASLFDMVPGAMELSPNAVFYIIIGYFIIHFFEHVFSSHFHFGEETHAEAISKNTAWTIFIALLVHTFLDGVAISAGFNVNSLVGFTIFAAVALHKIPDGFTIASVMLASGREKKGAFAASFVLALSTIAGALWAASFIRFTPLFLGIAAGAFLHIAMTDLIPEVVKKKNFIYFLALIAGTLLYYVTRIALIQFGVA